jgi:hypothetical protein
MFPLEFMLFHPSPALQNPISKRALRNLQSRGLIAVAGFYRIATRASVMR